MAVKTYRAIGKGYIDGRVIKEGEIFAHEFTAIQREPKKPGELAGKIKRDKNGDPLLKPCDPPLWVEEVDKKEAAAAKAATDVFPDDVPLEGMELAALQALAATKNVDPTGLDKDGLITAIKAANDPKR